MQQPISVTLWHKNRHYLVIAGEENSKHSLQGPAIIEGYTHITKGPSFTIPGKETDYKKFECPKCLRLHPLPTEHGFKLTCYCLVTWSFWGAGAVSLEDYQLRQVMYSMISGNET